MRRGKRQQETHPMYRVLTKPPQPVLDMWEILGIASQFNGTIVSVDNQPTQGEGEMSPFNLQGYKPAAPKEEDSGFEPFIYEGKAFVEKAIQSVNTKVDSEFYPMNCNQWEIEVTVLDGEHAGRKLWKRFNLDDEKRGGKDGNGKTSIEKLADQLWAVGLEFKDKETLDAANEKLAGMTIDIKAWVATFKDETPPRKVQRWNIKGLAKEATPGMTSKPAF